MDKSGYEVLKEIKSRTAIVNEVLIRKVEIWAERKKRL